MASRGAGTLLTEFNAAYVAPGLMPGYQGHVPGVAFSFGSPYGTTTLKYLQEQRNAEKSHTPFRKGGHFLASLFPNPNQVLSDRSCTRDRWLHAPSCTRFNLDSSRAAELSRFYQVGAPGWAMATPLPSPQRPLSPHRGEGVTAGGQGRLSASRAPLFASSEPLSQQGACCR
ncbi:ciliary microtubule inner protein 2C isoform X3 [Balaenoptera ricei]|uniref:ciliary microtubule inner protein 2C isoform X3 n=1 Tax=Balaenoptera ricei TaxID=2746895 RepID=UPI0028BE778E|nr:ciliary microtubule inner protein 2C isoform X3 [Balaenoptera ricei]